MLFPADMNVSFDEDIAGWSKQGLETIVKVGMGVANAGGAQS